MMRPVVTPAMHDAIWSHLQACYDILWHAGFTRFECILHMQEIIAEFVTHVTGATMW